MDKRVIILFSLLALLTACVGLKCHKCTSEKDKEPCQEVEKGKESNFTTECSGADKDAGKVVCKTQEISGIFFRDCWVARKEEKIGCKDLEGGGKVCYCEEDNCNGKSGAGLGWNYPPASSMENLTGWIFTSFLLVYLY